MYRRAEITKANRRDRTAGGLAPEDAELVVADRDLAGLPILLNADRFTAWLQARLPEVAIGAAAAQYVRYKRGTSCLALFSVVCDGVVELVHAVAYGAGAAAKLGKQVSDRRGVARPRDAAIIDPSQRVVAQFFPLDRELRQLGQFVTDPAIALAEWQVSRRLAGPLRVRTVRYKPHRRFVGQLLCDDQCVGAVKLYTRDDYERARRNAKVFAGLPGLRIPARMGWSRRRRGLLFEWLPGERLADALARPSAPLEGFEAIGEAIADLHNQSRWNVGPTPARGWEAELHGAVRAIAEIAPALTHRAQSLAVALAALAENGGCKETLCHGDLYADQVVLGPDVGLIDFDRAGIGDPAADLGNFLAHLQRDVLLGDLDRQRVDYWAVQLLEGYRRRRSRFDDRRVAWHAAAGLLRLAVEPFRRRRPSWRRHAEAIIAEAETTAYAAGGRLGAPTRASPSRFSALPQELEPSSAEAEARLRAFLRRASDRNEAQRELPRALASTLQEFKSPVASTPRVLRVKAGRRFLVRYEILDRVDGNLRLEVLGKGHHRRQAARDLTLQRAIFAAGFDPSTPDGIAVPEPLAVVEDWNVWLQRVAPGVESSSLLSGPDRTAHAVVVAEAIHKLHAKGPPPSRLHTLDDEMRILGDRLRQCGTDHPEWQRRLGRVLAACCALASSLRSPRRRPIHRDFYPAQVLIHPSGVVLCDLDLYSWGDPAVDVGNFAGHILEQGLREFGDPGACVDAAAELCDHYISLGSDVDARSIDAFTTLTLARHIQLCCQLPGRQGLTEPLLELCERRLA